MQSFVTLPKELQHEIYDKLEIEDRGNLNIAMPKNAIRKTLKTDLDKDRKLRVIAHYMKRTGSRRYCYNNMIKFMLDNETDPTSKKLIREMSGEDNKGIFSPRMVYAFLNGNVTYIKELKHTGVIEDIDVQTIVFEGFKFITSDFLRACEENNIAQNVLLNILSTTWNKNIVVFSLVYFSNEDGLKHLSERKDVYDLHESWKYVTCPSVAVLFLTGTSVKLLFKYFDVDDVLKTHMLDYAYQMMNMNVIKALIEVGASLQNMIK